MLGKARRSASRGIMHKRALALAIVFLGMAGAAGGAELAIANNWSVKAEYLFADLGTEKKTFATPAAFTATVPAGFANVSIRRTDNIARVGLNYKFAPF
jgi:opacity protein-like surface antigen